MSKENKQSFMGGVTVLAISTILVKICGAIYKIPLNNILGEQGITYFNSAYNIYTVLLTVATAGLPLALSKLVSEADSTGRKNQMRRCFQTAMALFLAIGAAGTAVMLLFTERLAAWMNNSLAYWPIKALGVSVICVSVMCAYRGYAQGRRNMVPTAASQFIESFFKLLVGLPLAWYLINRGYSLDIGAAGAIVGVSAGIVLGLAEESAASLYGQYSFGMTLFNLPSSFLPAVAVSLVPAISVAVARRDHPEVNRIVSASFRIIAVLAIPAGVGLSVLAGPILRLLYPAQQETAAAATYHLQLLGITSIFVCVMLLTNSIMQAHEKVRLPIYTMLVGGAAKVAVNYLLVGNPDINIKGAPIGTLICYVLIALMNLTLVYGLLEHKPSYLGIFLKPALASAAMGGAAWGCQGLFSRLLGGSYMAQGLATLLAIGAAVVVYGVLVIALRIITREDLKLIPKGEKIARILHIR